MKKYHDTMDSILESILKEKTIFVFGSNAAGHHNGGAAQVAMERYGAEYGVAEGMQGLSYAIPTVGVTMELMARAIARFCLFAHQHPKYHFKVTAIGCGHAGYQPCQIAPFFMAVRDLPNVQLPKDFLIALYKLEEE